MLTNNITRLSDRRRHVPNYPDERASTAGKKNFPWRRTTEGQLALVALLHFVESRMTLEDAQYRSNYASHGVTEESCFHYLRRAVPELFPVYEATMGKPMAVELPIKRVYMWFLQHNGKHKPVKCSKGMKREHPRQWASVALLNAGLDRFRRTP